MKILACIIVFLSWVNIVFGAEYVVMNNTTQTYTVTNKCTAKTVVKTKGCACSSGMNCSAGFCKANGGTGCPDSCPINVAKANVPAPLQFQAQSSCANGKCDAASPQRQGWYPGKVLGR